MGSLSHLQWKDPLNPYQGALSLIHSQHLVSLFQIHITNRHFGSCIPKLCCQNSSKNTPNKTYTSFYLVVGGLSSSVCPCLTSNIRSEVLQGFTDDFTTSIKILQDKVGLSRVALIFLWTTTLLLLHSPGNPGLAFSVTALRSVSDTLTSFLSALASNDSCLLSMLCEATWTINTTNITDAGIALLISIFTRWSILFLSYVALQLVKTTQNCVKKQVQSIIKWLK